jgi:hypothetical protein
VEPSRRQGPRSTAPPWPEGHRGGADRATTPAGGVGQMRSRLERFRYWKYRLISASILYPSPYLIPRPVARPSPSLVRGRNQTEVSGRAAEP